MDGGNKLLKFPRVSVASPFSKSNCLWPEFIAKAANKKLSLILATIIKANGPSPNIRKVNISLYTFSSERVFFFVCKITCIQIHQRWVGCFSFIS